MRVKFVDDEASFVAEWSCGGRKEVPTSTTPVVALGESLTYVYFAAIRHRRRPSVAAGEFVLVRARVYV